MNEVIVYRETLCKLCHKYINNLKEFCEKNNMSCKEVYLEKEVFSIIRALFTLREMGYTINVLPITTIVNGECILDAWDGFKTEEEIEQSITKYIRYTNET